MKHTLRSIRRRGITLIEVLVASIVLAVAAVSVMNVFRGSAMGVRKTDEKRELRYYLAEVFSHLNRRPLHELWDAYGPPPHASRSIAGAMVLTDASNTIIPDADPLIPKNNPLGLTQSFVDELHRDRIGVKIWFNFYYRQEDLDYSGTTPNSAIGLLHMQAGIARVALYSLDDPEERHLSEWRQPIMCPMIVGRPGIKLSSCPALSNSVKCEYGPLVAAAEGRTWTADDAADAGGC